jgi:hypothetical protein
MGFNDVLFALMISAALLYGKLLPVRAMRQHASEVISLTTLRMNLKLIMLWGTRRPHCG